MWEMIFGPLGVDFGHLEVLFWPVKGEFRHCFSNLGPLGVDFWCLVVKWKTLGIAIRPLSVLLIVEGVMCFGAISSYVGFSWALRNANETSLVFKIFQNLHNY